jgi:hypothetical protein
MQTPPNGSEPDEDDTAFGGLAPRGGPGTKRPPANAPGRPPGSPPGKGQDHRVRWLAIAGVVVVLVLAWLYYGARH